MGALLSVFWGWTAEPTAEELDEMELTFLSEFLGLMNAAHYDIIGASTWKVAQAERFTVRRWDLSTIVTQLCRLSKHFRPRGTTA